MSFSYGKLEFFNSYPSTELPGLPIYDQFTKCVFLFRCSTYTVVMSCRLFEIISLGEFPSSSASDIDNLNNQTVTDKAAPSKASHVGGKHVIVARNHPHLVRLLDFVSLFHLVCPISPLYLLTYQREDISSLVQKILHSCTRILSYLRSMFSLIIF